MTDTAIIKLFFDRDERAVTELSGKYGREMRGYAKRYLRDDRDAEEICSDTLVDIWNSIPPEHPNRLGAYVMTVIKRKVINKLRYLAREKRSREGEALYAELDDVLNYAGSEKSAEDAVIDDSSKILGDFLKSENRTNRIIFVKRYYYGKSVAEISRDMAMTESAVLSRLSRSKARLHERLTREGVM